MRVFALVFVTSLVSTAALAQDTPAPPQAPQPTLEQTLDSMNLKIYDSLSLFKSTIIQDDNLVAALRKQNDNLAKSLASVTKERDDLKSAEVDAKPSGEKSVVNPKEKK